MAAVIRVRGVFDESSFLGLKLKMGGKFHLKLNTGERPIANKYCEGKMQRTLKRELKVPEIAVREAIVTSVVCVHLGAAALVAALRARAQVRVSSRAAVDARGEGGWRSRQCYSPPRPPWFGLRQMIKCAL